MKDEKIQVKMIQSVDEVDWLNLYGMLYGSGSGYGAGCGSFWGYSGSINNPEDYNNCYFNTLFSIGENYGLNVSKWQLHNNYFNSNFWDYAGTPEEQANGPNSTIHDGNGNDIPNPDTHSFINIYFTTKDDSWQTNPSTIEDYCVHNKGDNKGIVIAVLDLGPGHDYDHVVILKHAQGNIYTYDDPTSGEKNLEIHVSHIRYATKITGLRTD